MAFHSFKISVAFTSEFRTPIIFFLPAVQKYVFQCHVFKNVRKETSCLKSRGGGSRQNGHLSRLFLFSFDDGTEAKIYTTLVGDRILAIYSGTKPALLPL